jgi:hypothetical protein
LSDGSNKIAGFYRAPAQNQSEGWARQFHAWAENHDRTTPLLSDDAVSRESLYPDRT